MVCNLLYMLLYVQCKSAKQYAVVIDYCILFIICGVKVSLFYVFTFIPEKKFVFTSFYKLSVFICKICQKLLCLLNNL